MQHLFSMSVRSLAPSRDWCGMPRPPDYQKNVCFCSCIAPNSETHSLRRRAFHCQHHRIPTTIPNVAKTIKRSPTCDDPAHDHQYRCKSSAPDRSNRLPPYLAFRWDVVARWPLVYIARANSQTINDYAGESNGWLGCPQFDWLLK